MKEKVLHWLAYTTKILSMVAGVSSYMTWIPQKYLPIAAISFGVASILKDTVNRIGDLLDDGAVNNSFEAPDKPK